MDITPIDITPEDISPKNILEEFVINPVISTYMADFQYFGLFLDTDTRNRLMGILTDNIDFNIALNVADRILIDHCTLLHKSQLHGNSKLYEFLESNIGRTVNLKLTAVGISDKAMAFKVQFYPTDVGMCTNSIPHITIATFNGGKPVDSNYIRHWKDIEPIEIITTLNKI